MTRTNRSLWAAAVFAITLGVFWPAIHYGFLAWDDDKGILGNAHLAPLGIAALKWMFTTFYLGPYQPLTWLSLAVDRALWGFNPAGYHFTNILIHAANAALLFYLASRIFATRWEASSPAAFAAALMFALHPLRVPSVVWVSERRDVLSGFFYLMTVLLYLNERKKASLASFLCALLSKGIAVTLPAALVLIDAIVLNRFRKPWRRKENRTIMREKIPFIALSFIFLGLGIFGQAPAMRAISEYGLGDRIAQAGFGAMFYVAKTFIPIHLSPIYDLPNHVNPFSSIFILSIAGTIVASIAAFAMRRQVPALTAAWIFYLTTLLPVLGLFQFGGELAAERYSYISCLAWPLLAAGTVLSLRPGVARILAGAGLVAVIALFAAETRSYSEIWRDSISLYDRVLRRESSSYLAHHNLGIVLAASDRLPEAKDHFESCLRVKPNSADDWVNLGLIELKEQRPAEAETNLRRAVELDQQNKLAHNALGLTLARKGQWTEAAREYDLSIRIDPDFAEAHNNLGITLAQSHDFDRAIEEFRKALELNPDYRQAWLNLEHALDDKGLAAGRSPGANAK